MEQRTQSHAALPALKAVGYLSPLLEAVCFVAVYTIIVCTRTPPKRLKTPNRSYFALGLLLAVVLSFVTEAGLYLARALLHRGWWAAQHSIIYVMASILVWGALTLLLMDSKHPAWQPYLGATVTAGLSEIVICALSAAVVPAWNQFEDMQLAVRAVRVALLGLLSAVCFRMARRHRDERVAAKGETSPFLSGDALTAGAARSTQYGTAPTATATDVAGVECDLDDDDDHMVDENNKEARKQQRQRMQEQGGWWGYLKGFALFIPFVIPLKDRRARAAMSITLFCIVAERFLNVLTPRQLGIITDRLADGAGSGRMPSTEVLLWFLFRFLSSSACLGGLRHFMSVLVGQCSYRAISTMAFSHVMNLSMSFHHSKDSGEIYRAINDAYSLNDLLDVLFDTAPVLVDFVVAFWYISYLFDVYVAFTVVVVLVLYVGTGLRLTAWSAPKRRLYTEKGREYYRAKCESISNWETVSYFNRNRYEEGRLVDHVTGHMDALLAYYLRVSLVQAVQSLIMTLGLLTVSFLAVHRISRGDAPVGSFITLITYWSSIMSPISTIVRSYRAVSNNLIDAERLLQLLKTPPSVVDRGGAHPLVFGQGRVEFQGVSFHYDARKTVLDDVDFAAEPGSTVALVGETGCGKSTILRLLFRFYDVSKGRIRIDGQDVRDVTLSSLRESLGLVPQDPSLFNQSILENVRYARLDATDEQVQQACKAAAIHDKIMTFPDGYASKVGERGVKLSGGELQRVAIARVILRDPQIVLLDEATSAVDSTTEAQIQKAFKRLSAGRTTIVIAHRLSTIQGANLILVIDNGRIVERGRHEELIRMEGKYTELWSKQASRQSGEEEGPRAGAGAGPGAEPTLIDTSENDERPNDT